MFPHADLSDADIDTICFSRSIELYPRIEDIELIVLSFLQLPRKVQFRFTNSLHRLHVLLQISPHLRRKRSLHPLLN